MHEDTKPASGGPHNVRLRHPPNAPNADPPCVLSLPVKRMAKWLAISILVLVLLTGILITRRYQGEERARETREAEYELARRRYFAALRLGISRKEVEHYFREISVGTTSRSSDELLVKIGQEEPPWFCSDGDVYIAFQFDHHGKNSAQWPPNDSDTLIAITVLHWSARCL